ncbi:MAG: hypothetical protein WCI46_03980 [Verrucomicrobiota bacterium]
MNFHEIKTGQPVLGLGPTSTSSVVVVVPITDEAIQVIDGTPDGAVKDCPPKSR